MKLEPCPFCGGPAEMDAHFGREWWVRCSDFRGCSASDGRLLPTEADAVAAWNRRAHPASLQKPMAWRVNCINGLWYTTDSKDDAESAKEIGEEVIPLYAQPAAPVDDPDCDGTDGAHPAWWRGHDDTCRILYIKLQEILDGRDDGRGVANQPWQGIRNRIRELVASQPAAPATPRQQVKLGVVEFHPQDALREQFYLVVNDLRAAGCIVDLWLLDIAAVLKNHGYSMEVYRAAPKEQTP